jgi:hypothetical protein
MTHAPITLRVGRTQLCGLEIYIFDPCHDDDGFPGTLAGFVLTVTDCERACELLTDAANSADDDKDAPVRDALTTLCARLRRAELPEE